MASPVEIAKKDYETVAASQTAQILGDDGQAGDVLDKVIVVPETTAAGTVALLDGSTSTNIFVTGTLADLSPITIDLGGIASVNGPWKITTGANVHVIACGRFT
jgi:hypothetical protein